MDKQNTSMSDDSNHSPDRRAREIFSAAVGCSPGTERESFLDRACAGDDALRRDVASLLVISEQDAVFMARPAVDVPPAPPSDSGTPSAQPGQHIGRYKIVRKIGEGGCGDVYLAEQEEPVRRQVALKIIKLGMDTKAVIARFEAERQALALMDHPNIAKVFDGGATESGRPYFVMELVQGSRITEYCEQARLSTKECIRLFILVCQAVQHAHQKGIIHRDLKPSNILVTLQDGVAVPKVIDFGIAKATTGQKLTDKTLFTAHHQFMGTPDYMSPEQAQMTGVDIDTRSDIYSLGVLLYELLTGTTPFDAQELLKAGLDEMCRTIRETEPEKPSTRLTQLASANARRRTASAQQQVESREGSNAGITAEPRVITSRTAAFAPAHFQSATRLQCQEQRDRINLLRGDLDWIVMKCLEKDRARRYETANDLAADFQRHLDHEPVIARPPSFFYQCRKTVQRNKIVVAAGTTVALSLLAGITVAIAMYFEIKAANDGQSRLRQQAEAALADLRSTAPIYAAQAQSLFAEQKVDESLTKIDFALRLAPDNADYHLVRANKLQALQRLPQAIDGYRKALALRPNDLAASNNLQLSLRLVHHEGDQMSAGMRVTLYQAIKNQGRGEDLWPLQRLIGQEAEAAKGLIEVRLKPLTSQPAWNEASLQTGKTRIVQLPDATFGVDLSRLTLSDLTLLRGLPITELFLHACQVTDLSPLAGMPLRRLMIGTTRVSDLGPLVDAPLEWLDASGSPVEDLSPLRGKRLVWLNLNNTQVRELGPLRAMPLETLQLTETPVESLEPLVGVPLKHLKLLMCGKIKDLTPLGGLPLEELDLGDCPNIRVLSPLVRCARLEKLIIPAQCRDLESLQRIPNLRRVANRRYSTDNYDWNSVPLAEDFFRQMEGILARENEVSPQIEKLRAELRRMKLVEYRVNQINLSPDGTLDIDLAKLALSDLSPLAGLPVKKLLLGRTRVQDLTPLRGAPLEYIDLYQCPVTDLTPLSQCTNLLVLRISGTDVVDLTPVLHLPLEELTLESSLAADVAPLVACKTLKRLILPRRATGIEALRSHPGLERICFEWKWSIGFHQTAAEFWVEYDSKRIAQ